MSILEYIGYTIAGLLVLQAVFSALYLLAIKGYNVSFRDDKYLGSYQKLKYGCKTFNFRNRLEDTLCTLLFFDTLVGGLFAFVIFALTDEGVLLYPLIGIGVLGSLLILPYALRYIVDIFRTLKMNNKTGDSERLRKLEEEIARLKEK